MRKKLTTSRISDDVFSLVALEFTSMAEGKWTLQVQKQELIEKPEVEHINRTQARARPSQ